MSLWRPNTRTEWWLAFVASLVLVPFGFSMGGMLLAQSLDAPLFYPAGILAAPVLACYLISYTRIHWGAKVLLICIAFAGIAFSYLPRSSCGEDVPQKVQRGAASEERNSVGGCNGPSRKT